MNTKLLPIALVLLATVTFVSTLRLSSEIPFPPAGNSGDSFTNNTCGRSGCHPSNVQNSSPNTLTLTIGTNTPTTTLDGSFQYQPNTQYNIGFLINAFTGRYGFQISSLDATSAQAGSFTVTNPATTKINTVSSRQYMGHLNASTTKNWTFRWTSPDASTGPVTFYYAYAAANNDGSPSGDQIYKGSVTINPAAVNVADINEKVSGLRIYPNPVNGAFAVSFNLKEDETIQAEIFSVDGKINLQLLNENASSGVYHKELNIAELPSGIYLLKLRVGTASVTQKVFKQ